MVRPIPHFYPDEDRELSGRAQRVLWGVAIALIAAVVVAVDATILYRYGPTVQAVAYSGAVILLGVASVTDLHSRVVPTVVVAAMLLLWVATVLFIPCGDKPGEIGYAFTWLAGRDSTAVALDGLAGGFIVGFGMLGLSVLVEARTGRESFGGGDVKLLLVVGLFLGLPASLTMLLTACLIAVALAMITGVLFPEGIASPNLAEPMLRLTIPFAPSIAIATALFLSAGPFSLF